MPDETDGTLDRARTRSPFAAALARLLDETSYFTRAEWARFLGVSTSAISQWVNDKTIPRADLLRILLDVLRTSDGVPREPLAEFDAVARRPAQEVSPLGARMMPTVTEYLRTGTFAALGRELRKLPPEQQERVLADGSWESGSSNGDPALPRNSVFLSHSHVERYIDPTLLPPLERTDAAQSPLRLQWTDLLSLRAVLVIGDVGSGKTAMLAALAKSLREQGHKPPVFIQGGAHWWRESGVSLLQLCERVARDSPCPVIVDGLDEIPEQRRARAAEEIVDLAHRLPAAQVFTASRPVPELSLLHGFEAFSVAPLTGLQVVLWLKEAVERSAASQATGCEDLERFLCHLNERQELASSLHNPLLLSSAWTLFARNAVTPFAEAELLGELARRLLAEWDRERNVIRAREPWASPHNLSAVLGELCFHLVHSRNQEFATSDAEDWMGARLADVPCDRLLSLLSVQSGILREIRPGRWCLARGYLPRYFAAAHVVESSDSAWQYLGEWPHRDDIRDVLRLACGITSDATALLQGVLRTADAREADRALLLAETLAQPVAAAPEVVAAGCDAMVAWLDTVFRGWRVDRGASGTWKELGPKSLWELRATSRTRGAHEQRISRALSAIHRARSGPARQPLVERLERVESPVLAEFASSLQVEGRLHVDWRSSATKRSLHATVVAPILA